MVAVVIALLVMFSLANSAHAQIVQQKIEIEEQCGFLTPCWFGLAVAIHGNTAAVGAPGRRSVYLYELGAEGWQGPRIIDSGGVFSFGNALAMDDVWLAVGANGDKPQGLFDAGSVHVYRRTNNNWTWAQVLVASDASTGAAFGTEVALEGNSILVGVPRHSGGGSGLANVGAVYVLELSAGAWIETQILLPSDGNQNDYFGSSIGIDGTTIIIGTPHPVRGPSAKPGAAYVFEHTNGIWKEASKLQASDGVPLDRFGGERAIAVRDDTAMISASGRLSAGGGGGAVYCFRKTSQGWNESAKLGANDPSPSTYFGSGVALWSDDVVIGARGDEDLGMGSGSAYHFRRIAGQWVQVGKLLSVDGEIGDDFGFLGVGLYGSNSIVGAPGEDPGGAAYLYVLSETGIQYCDCGSIGPCANQDDHGGCLNSSGQGGVFQACGGGGVVSDDLKMESRWLPQSVLGIVFMGSSPQQAPFGDGQLCVGPGNTGVFRFTPQDSASEGVITLGPGIVAYTHANFPPAGQIQPGQTWFFQTWYRDPTGPCGTGFNLTNGLKVDFKP